MKKENLFLNHVQDDFKNIKLSNIYTKDADSLNFKLINKISPSSSIKADSYSSNDLFVGTFQTSLLFSESDIQIIQCKTVNWSLFNRSESFKANSNPFIKLSRNQASFSKNEIETNRNQLIFFEKYPLLSPAFEKDSNTANIKSIVVNYDYKRECNGESSKCVNNFPLLEELTDYQLFLCNRKFQWLIYETFNCTPFYSSTDNKHLHECSVSITLLIYEIMVGFKEELFNCEYSKAKLPIQFNIETYYLNDASSDFDFKDQFAGVDFNGMKIYEQALNVNGPSS